MYAVVIVLKIDGTVFSVAYFLIISIWPIIALNNGMDFSYVILFLYLFAIWRHIANLN